MNENNSERLTPIRQRHDALLEIRQPWEIIWQENSDYIMPRRNPGIKGAITANTDKETRLFDSTAIHANMTLANGQLAWMSPQESAWFSYETPDSIEDDEADVWMSKATATVRLALARSKFYNVIHEFYLDRGGFGTACMFCEQSKNGGLHFELFSVGTFAIDEDDEGNIDTIFREYEWTARQCSKKFGEDNVSDEIKECMTDGKDCNRKFVIVHAIYPREDAHRDFGKFDDMNMPIASVYFEKKTSVINRESGYEEIPVFASRYLEWGTGTGNLYGWCPAFAAVPEARQVNFLQEMLDALAEKKAFPPILAPDEMEGEINVNAAEITYHDKAMAGQTERMPREWNLAGDYNIGKDRVEERQQSIRDAFHVDLFEMFAQLDKQMTAREVAARSQERLIQFSPTFARLTTELFEPLLARVFGIMLRSGALGQPPLSLIEDTGDGFGTVAVPKIEYNSRIAMALRALPAIATFDTFENVSAVAELVPSVLDIFDWDGAIRSAALAGGFPADFIRSPSEMAEIRKLRAEQEARLAEQEAGLQAADALGKMGKVPAESPVGEMIQGQFGQQGDAGTG